MDSRKLMLAVINGDEVDRVPVSFWRHFPQIDQTPEGLADATLSWHAKYTFDFIKIMPSISFCLKDWGGKDKYNINRFGVRTIIEYVVTELEDWEKITVHDPMNGYLGNQIKAINLIYSGTYGRVPLLQTIFSPLMQLQGLAKKEVLLKHAKTSPELITTALKSIFTTTEHYIKYLADSGEIDGIFYAVRGGEKIFTEVPWLSRMSRELDLGLLIAAQKLSFNTLHIHDNYQLHEYLSYPVSVLSAHGLHNINLLKFVLNSFSGAVCGGIRRFETMYKGKPEDVVIEAKKFIKAAEGRRIILGSECGLPIETAAVNINAAISVAVNNTCGKKMSLPQ